MKIDNFEIRKGNAFIIAELSGNHNNDLGLAKDTISAMAEAGADAVKLQTYTADSLTMNVDNAYFGPRDSGPWKGRKPYDVFQEGALPYEWHEQLFEHSKANGMISFSSPFDVGGVDFLMDLDVPAFKLASFEISHIPLIEKLAAQRKPVIISTGIARLQDIDRAVSILKDEDCPVAVLKCTSSYPATFKDANLRSMVALGEAFGVPVGVSDHTMGATVPIVAVTLGASIIEKHFILDRDLGGVDASFSLNKDEFASMVKSVREVEECLGAKDFCFNHVAKESARRGRSIFALIDIKPGDVLSERNLTVVRAAEGLHPEMWKELIGRKASFTLNAGDPLTFRQLMP